MSADSFASPVTDLMNPGALAIPSLTTLPKLALNYSVLYFFNPRVKTSKTFPLSNLSNDVNNLTTSVLIGVFEYVDWK
jgi:hypothetical protein